MKSVLVYTFLLILFCVATVAHADIMPHNPCEVFDAVSSETRGFIASRYPIENALNAAVEQKLSPLGLFTKDVWRNSCYVYISDTTLKTVHERYDLDLLVPIMGHDVKGNSFEMVALLGGFGKQ